VSIEDNKAAFRRWFADVVNQNKYEVVEELLAPDYVCHMPGAPPTDRDGHRGMVEFFAASFPDWSEEVEDMIAAGDKVVGRMSAGGTHTAAFQGIEPSGKRITISGIGIMRFNDEGKVAESWWEFDAVGLMTQLGAIPAPEAEGATS